MLARGQGTFSPAICHASSRNRLVQGQGTGWPWEAHAGVFRFLSMLIFKQRSAFWSQGLSGSGPGHANSAGLNACVSCWPEGSLTGRQVLSPEGLPGQLLCSFLEACAIRGPWRASGSGSLSTAGFTDVGGCVEGGGDSLGKRHISSQRTSPGVQDQQPRHSRAPGRVQ